MKMKYQQGGAFTPPFAVYQPHVLPDSAESLKSSVKKSSDNGVDMSDVYKLLDNLKEALPGDVRAVQGQLGNLFNSIERKLMSGNTMLAGTGSIAYEYLSAMSLINKLQFAHDEYKTAKTEAIKNGAIQEYAIDTRGRVIVATEEGFEWKTPEEVFENPDKYTPITNAELLDMRAKGVGGLAFNQESLQTVAAGTSMSAITKLISDSIDKLGKDVESYDSYASVKSGQMIRSLQDFVSAREKSGNYDATVEDLYKANLLTENQAAQAKQALTYIYNTLPQTAVSMLKMKSNGTTQGAQQLIDALVTSKMSNRFEMTSLDLKKGPTSTKDNSDQSNPYLQLIREEGGERRNFVIVPGDSNKGLSFTGTFYSKLPRINSEMSISELLSTGLQGITKQGTKGISFGDQILDPSQLSHVMFDNEGATVATLPIITDVLGNIKVNMSLIDDYNLVKEEMKKYKGLSEIDRKKKEAELLHEYELDELIDATTGLPDQTKTAQFLVIGAYTTDQIEFDKKSKYIKKIENPSKELEERIVKGLSTDKDKSNYSIDVDDHWGFLEGFWDDIYRANVFIPLGQNPNAAINAWGDKRSEAAVSESEKQYQDWIKLTQMKPTYEIE